jgi:hypothetical protein
MNWVQVQCPSSPLPSQPQWGPAYQGPPMGPTGQTTGGGIDYGRLATTAGRKLLACSDKAAGFALSFVGSKGFYDGYRATRGIAQNFLKAVRSNAGAGGSMKKAARNAADIMLYGQGTVRSASETLGALGGSGIIAYQDTYFTPATARNALELAVGFIPFVGTAWAGIDLAMCLVEK